MQDVRAHHTLVCPRIAELDLLIDDTVGAVFLRKLVYILAAAGHLCGVHISRALAAVHILAADLREGILIIGKLYGISAGERTVAEAVGADICAAVLNKLYKIGIIDLRADDNDTGAIGLILRLAGLELLKGLLELVDEQIFRRNIGREGYDLELIAGDTRLVALAELADGADKLAYAVVLGDRLTDGCIGGIDAVCLVQRIEYMVLALESV